MKRIYILLIALGLVIFSYFLLKEPSANTQPSNENSINEQAEKEQNKEENIKEEEKDVVVGVNMLNKAPSFTLQDQNGNDTQLDDYLGKKVIITFWTSWCKYCQAEIKELIALYEEKDPDVTILSINVTTEEKNENNAYQYVEKNQLPFKVLFDVEGTITQLYRVQGYPTNFFLDENGIIQQMIVGGITREDVKNIFRK